MWLSKRLLLQIALAVGISYTVVIVGIFIAIISPIQIGVLILAKLFRRDLKFFVFGMNAALTTENPSENTFNLLNIAVLDGKITVEDFRDKFNERVLQLRDCSNRLVYQRLQETFTGFLGYTFWQNVSASFSLENHVRDYDHQGELVLPSPCTEADLMRISGELLTVPWREGQSPWELLVLQNFREENSEADQSVLILRNHHALMDGYSIVGLWQAFSGRDRISMPRMKSRGGMLKKLMLPLKAPLDAADTLINSLEGQKCIQLNDTQRYFFTCSTPEILVSDIKMVKNKFRVNYSAVLFAAFTGAFVRIMNEAGKEVPEELAAYMAGPRPNHPGGAANHMVCLGCRWKAKTESPNERLVQISRNIEALKNSSLPMALDLFMFGYALVPRFIARFLFTKMTLAGGSIFASSFPVSDDHFYLDDLKISASFVAAGTTGLKIGMSILATGTAGRTRLVMTIDKRLLPQVDLQQKLGLYVKDEIDGYVSEAEYRVVLPM